MNPIKDLVSIITPVYNAQSTLKATLDGIVSQSYKDWELILVNDASTDDSKAIAEPYLKKDKRIQWIEMAQNSGAAKARNFAIDHARGQYLAFLDSDDAWDSNKLEKQLKFMRDNAYAFTFTAYRTTRGRIVKAPNVLSYKELITNNQIGCLTVIIDRRSTGDFLMADYRKGQDHLTWLMLMKRGIKAYGLNEVLATYTEGNTNSLSGNKIKSAKRQWFNYRKALGLGFFKSTLYFIKYVYYSLKKHGFKL
ncbi:MAG: glycosyltransferase family 2 protein [Erysipelotrichaceae bacterium]|nr:glycosyltransferase family 2 protein [Erysipelotrichaceae bacterium]